MGETAPIYLAYINSDDKGHICVGVAPVTICGDQSISSAVQIGDSDDPLSILEDNSRELCSECENNWNSIEEKVSSEQTVECHRCKSQYAACLARMVTHQTDGDNPICRPCYKELVENDNSGVSIPYDEAEPFRESNNSESDRELDLHEE